MAIPGGECQQWGSKGDGLRGVGLNSQGISLGNEIQRGDGVPAKTRQKPVLGLAFVFLAFGSGCAKSRLTGHLRSQAPTSQEDTGIVVQMDPNSATERLEALVEAQPQVRIRSLSERHGLFEVFNLGATEVTKALEPNQQFQNFYFENLVPKRPNSMAVDFSACKRESAGAPAPSVVIEPTNLKVKLRDRLIDIKDGAVSFSSAGTRSLNPAAPKFELVWLVQGPPGSAIETLKAETPNLTFTPDMPGSYSVTLVAQDGLKTCGLEGFEFGVTYNEAFLGATPARAYDPLKDGSLFFHLSEIGAPQAWTVSKGAGSIIAILDSGVNYNHPDLRGNILLNTKEVAGNGRDDDGNGYIDDTVGWDFFANDSMPIDDNMHGTHVAGLAAGGVGGVAPSAKILPVKVMGPMGSGDSASILTGIYYAADRGAHIINMSLGVDSFGMSIQERTMIHSAYKKAADYARQKGAVIIAAAGNGDPIHGIGFDIDKTPTYPASVSASNVMAVGSVDSQGKLTKYSNFGNLTVQVAAPGGADGDTALGIPDRPLMAPFYYHARAPYIGLMGTSMACPVAAGALAVIRSAQPTLNPDGLLKTLRTTGVPKATLNGKVRSGAVINVANAVKPSAPNNPFSVILGAVGF